MKWRQAHQAILLPSNLMKSSGFVPSPDKMSSRSDYGLGIR